MSLFGVKGRIQTCMVDDESMLGTIVDNSEKINNYKNENKI